MINLIFIQLQVSVVLTVSVAIVVVVPALSEQSKSVAALLTFQGPTKCKGVVNYVSNVNVSVEYSD